MEAYKNEAGEIEQLKCMLQERERELLEERRETQQLRRILQERERELQEESGREKEQVTGLCKHH